MGFTELFFLASALSMDAFAVAICVGLSAKKFMLKNAIIVGLYFGIFQAVMPLIGYLIASQFTGRILQYDHWIAFALLSLLGTKMIVGSFKKDDDIEENVSLSPVKMIPFAVATSIDALAVGVSFAFIRVNVISAVILIGITTFILSAAGVKLGSIFGTKFKAKAEFFGGLVLILIGCNILRVHFGWW